MIYKSFKVELDPNNVQRTACAKACGVARFAYNWMLGTIKEDYESGARKLRPSAISMHKELNRIKKTNFPWMYESSKCNPQFALRHCEDAYKRFFKAQAKFPRFKRKGVNDSATFDGAIHVTDTHIRLPRIGKIRLKEHGYAPDGKPKKATISQKAGRWFVSVSYEVEIESHEWNDDVIGIDLGIKELAKCSDETSFENSGKLKKKEKKLKREQKRLSKKRKGSNNRKKQRSKLASTHKKVADHRRDILHKTTSCLARTKQAGVLIIEDLNVSGMMKNHNLARSIANCGFHEFRRQLEYKCEWYGKNLIMIDRFFPSSKKCSNCGSVKTDLKLSDRTYSCECGYVQDRDLNAAINICREGIRILSTVSSTASNASGDGRLQARRKPSQCPSVNEEENVKFAHSRFV